MSQNLENVWQRTLTLILKIFLPLTKRKKHKLITSYSNYFQILCVLFILTSTFEINYMKIQTVSPVLNLFYQKLFVLYLFYGIICQRLEKKFKPVDLLFQWHGHVQRIYLTVARLSVA